MHYQAKYPTTCKLCHLEFVAKKLRTFYCVSCRERMKRLRYDPVKRQLNRDKRMVLEMFHYVPKDNETLKRFVRECDAWKERNIFAL